jgi:hypothetical protein
VSWRTPYRPDHEIRSNIIWDGNTAITYPFDVAATQVARVVADLTFVFKGWLFQALPDFEIGNVFTIHSNFQTVEQGIPSEYRYEDENTKIPTTAADYLTLSGVPPRPKVIFPTSYRAEFSQQFNLYGSGFTSIKNVYLSGNPLIESSTLQNPFSSIPTLSSVYEPFYAVKLDSSKWKYDQNFLVTFAMPTASTAGFVDVIVEGPHGLGSLIQSAKVATFNPYTTAHPEHNSYIPCQLPFLSGIRVIQPVSAPLKFSTTTTPVSSIDFISEEIDLTDPPVTVFNVFNEL